MLRYCLPIFEALQYPRMVGNTEVIYLDQDQEADLFLTGFVQLNDFSFRLIQKSQCLEDLKDIAPEYAMIGSGTSSYYLLTV